MSSEDPKATLNAELSALMKERDGLPAAITAAKHGGDSDLITSLRAREEVLPTLITKAEIAVEEVTITELRAARDALASESKALWAERGERTSAWQEAEKAVKEINGQIAVLAYNQDSNSRQISRSDSNLQRLRSELGNL
jgi:chromosome segregation ATPase